MNIFLSSFQKIDLTRLDTWCKDIQAHQFMSHFTPKKFKRGDSVVNSLWNWYTIHAGRECIGTVWLEKENNNSETVVLGILLGSFEKFNQGIGRNAILLAIQTSCKTLDFKTVQLNVRKSNKRAISCYRNCGFSIISEGTKVKRNSEVIPYFTMQFEI